MATQDIVQKLWNLCDVLRDDGINYSNYVTELVLLLFIKMEHENAESGILQAHKLPDYARWATRLLWLANLRDSLPGAAALSERWLGLSAERSEPLQ